jgi:hypothetical protein
LGYKNYSQIIVHDKSVLIMNLKSIKYAKQCIEKWHMSKYAVGYTMMCQLELDIKMVPKQKQPRQKLTTAAIEDISSDDCAESNVENLSKSSMNVGVDQSAPEARNGETEPKSFSDFPRSLTEGDLIDPSRLSKLAFDDVRKQVQGKINFVVSKG